MDHVLAQLEAMCAPGAPPLMFPMAQTLPFKGEVRLTEKLLMPSKDTIKMPPGLTAPFQGNVPINTQVRVPLFPHGPTVDVPINPGVLRWLTDACAARRDPGHARLRGTLNVHL
jgi:hypothetical protein